MDWLYSSINLLIRSVLIDGSSPTIHSRSRKFIALSTGLRLVDVLFPVAQGQRELVIGDRQTGKSSILFGTSLAQKYRNMYSMTRKYVHSFIANLGQRTSTSVRLFNIFLINGSMFDVCIVIASITSTMTAQYTGPLFATAISELDRNTGTHCYIAYDDFSKHSVAFRQLCLFLRKPAGREAFPSDVFYLHARILERSCCLSHANSLGTLMSLPVIETLSNDLSAYIATNVISITDGQLYLDVSLFGQGQCPAISTDKSVSRVGGKSLDNVFRLVSFGMQKLISDYKQEVEIATKSEVFMIRHLRYQHVLAMFVQRSSFDRWVNILYLWVTVSGALDNVSTELVHSFIILVYSNSVNSVYQLWQWDVNTAWNIYGPVTVISRIIWFAVCSFFSMFST